MFARCAGDEPEPVFAKPGDDRQMVRDERYKLIRYSNSNFEGFFDLSTAPPNGDGDPLCTNDCPDGLDDAQREAYERLAALLDGIRDS